MLREFSFEVFEPVVPGVPVPWRFDSGPFRSLLIPNRSPKLLRPVDVEARGCGGPSRSSNDSRPSELIVDDLPLRFTCDLVGDEAPLFLERGRNKAVAGEALALWKRALPGEEPGGVFTPSPVMEARAVWVC